MSQPSPTDAALRSAAVWAFDVDGTLIGTVRGDVLRPGAHELLRRLAERGTRCVIWSAGGAEYAKRMAIRHGLDEFVTAYYDKGSRDGGGLYGTDDFDAEHLPDVFVDDVPSDLPAGALVVGVAPFLGGSGADRVLLDLLASVDRATT